MYSLHGKRKYGKRKERNIKMTGAKIVIHFCIIIMILAGVGLAEDRDVIVGFNKVTSDEQKKTEIETYNGTVNKNFHIINAVSAKIPVEKINIMKKDPRIKYVSNVSKYKMLDEYSNSWGVQYIGSQAVHNQNINGTGVNISVLDTGIDYNHIELQNNYKGGYNFISGNADPWDDNCLSYYKTCHGTHVSGIIAAESNGIGIIGVSPKSNIYAVKVLDAAGFGDSNTVISGIDWAIENGANIISMSLGMYPDPVNPDNDIALLDAVNTAYSQGILIVAGAGNGGGTEVLYPAAFDNVIAVGAIDQNAQKASFSPINPKIELTAPGVNIYSTVKGGYAYLSGTSQATPFVTGVAALIMSSNYPDVNGDGIRNNKDVRKILDDTALDVGASGRDDIFGYGIVDASNATIGIPFIDLAADLSISIDDNTSNIVIGNTYNYTITVKNNGPGDANDVKVFDTWPNGLIRTALIPSQGICDDLVNFTCNLGTIVKDGIARITAQYMIPTGIPLGNYTDKVEAEISSDYNSTNNIARDENILEAVLDIIRVPNCLDTNLRNSCDTKSISLDKGNYSLTIKNINLSGLDINVYENSTLTSSKKYKLKKSQIQYNNIEINTSRLDFIPHGDKGTKAQVIIRKNI